MRQYFDGVPIPSGTSSIKEEYDQTIDNCDWHIRKYFNGYCELVGAIKLKNLEIKSKTWGDWCEAGSSLTGQYDLPFEVHKFTEYFNINSVINYDVNACLALFIYPWSTKLSEYTTKTGKFVICRPASFDKTVDVVVSVNITGYWKWDSSEVSTNSQSDTTPMIDILLPDTTSIASTGMEVKI